MNTQLATAPSRDTNPPNRIRVETAVTRFPIHCLSRKGSVTIDLQRLSETGEPDFKWEVTYNTKHGQPGPLAYKVDTLVINRLLDQLGRPLPELLRIGSLSDVCRQLGTQDTGPNIANLKSAFLQNASAFINAKIRYKMKSGREKWIEMGYTRYSVIFTGEALPDGTQADAVHIVLNPPYRELLNHVETRPLDYDYLKKLPPGSQRLYELLSFQVYGAIAGCRPRAKMLYSDYCKYAPQVRYFDFDHVKKQMFKLHAPHRESGYITKVDYQGTKDSEGNADWEVFYTPGAKAFTEYEAFTNRRPHHPMLTSPSKTTAPECVSPPLQAELSFNEFPQELLREMMARGVAEKKARELLLNLKPGQEPIDQLEYVDHLISKDRKGKLDNPPGLYVYYVRDNIQLPADFRSSRMHRAIEQDWQRKESELAKEQQQEAEYAEYLFVKVDEFANSLPADEYSKLFKEQRSLNLKEYPKMTPKQIDDVTHKTVRRAIADSGRVMLLSFKDFVERG